MSALSQLGRIGMNAVTSTVSNTLNAAMTVGKAALHAAAPDNYEYYLCSLELLSSNADRIGFISFIVMPNNISESTQPIQTQTKTKSGLITLFNDSFCPVSISLQGTFGRKFRLVTGLVDPADASDKKWKNFLNGNFGKIKDFTIGVKSGYGMTRVLKYILERANTLDDNSRPYILLYNNYSFNSSYVVDVINYSFNQSTENNMLWFYNLQLKAVAPGSAVKTNKQNMGSLLAAVASNAIAQGLTKLVNDVKRNNTFKYI